MREQVAAETRRAVMSLARRLRAERPADALSSNKVSVLGHLYRRGPSTPTQIAVAEHQQPQSLTRVFAELEDEGLIARTPSPHDRRASVLELTPAGREVLARDVAVRDHWLATAMEGLNETEVQVIGLAAALLTELAERDQAVS
ncbi:DNA-binding transcriptional regulator, MarR family [Nonomuraea solani]|uniref:DNA-binding transcriptional regulator, MarR family n=1 Tax=Nonomuraea solani TaxID=1144553 RepID=A0A1H6EUF9_9ACTN|nr:MarR family transcriptional regulator [Nonomuraea solani]SEH01003.1 DNA-binding transcriptional regulator, MarR family [Nonomuraea solani]